MMSKDHALTHIENRKKVCLFCLKKNNSHLFEVKGKLQERITVLVNYDFNDERLPSVICTSCRMIVYRQTDINKKCAKGSLNFPDYSNWTYPNQLSTRSNDGVVCTCTLCQLARSRSQFNFSSSNKSELKSKNFKNKVKKCPKCLTMVSRGKNHNCNNTSNYDNVKEHINDTLNPKEKQQLICHLIKNDVTVKSDKQISEQKIALSQKRVSQ